MPNINGVDRGALSDGGVLLAINTQTALSALSFSDGSGNLRSAIDAKQDEIDSTTALSALSFSDGSGNLRTAIDAKQDQISGVTNAELAMLSGIDTADDPIEDRLDSLSSALSGKQSTIDAANRLGADLIAGGLVSDAEFNKLNGINTAAESIEFRLSANSSAISGKQNQISSSNRLSADLIGNGSVSTAEFNMLNGIDVTGDSIETRLDALNTNALAGGQLQANASAGQSDNLVVQYSVPYNLNTDKGVLLQFSNTDGTSASKSLGQIAAVRPDGADFDAELLLSASDNGVTTQQLIISKNGCTVEENLHVNGNLTVDGTVGLAAADIPSLDTTKITSGTFAQARIPGLAASKITSGTFNEARIPVLSTSKIPNLAASKITSGTFDDARIPNLAAGKITSGTFNDARIPNLAASKITSGTFNANRIPNLNASKITAGTFDKSRLPQLTIQVFKTTANGSVHSSDNFGLNRALPFGSSTRPVGSSNCCTHNTSNGVFTFSQSGTYRIDVKNNARWYNNNTSVRHQVAIYLSIGVNDEHNDSVSSLSASQLQTQAAADRFSQCYIRDEDNGFGGNNVITYIGEFATTHTNNNNTNQFKINTLIASGNDHDRFENTLSPDNLSMTAQVIVTQLD